MADYIMNGEGNFFYQLKRSTPFKWLTCTGVGDIDIPMGDLTPMYCPDPLNSGDYKIEGFVRGDAGQGTYSIERPLMGVYNWLLELKCDFQGRINWVCRGNRQDPRNWEIACILHHSEATRKGIPQPVRALDGSDARVRTTLDVGFTELIWIYSLVINRQTVTNTADGRSVFFLPERCEDRCGSARDLCEYGIIGTENPSYPGYLYDTEVKYTKNSGSSWAASATDPFAYGGDIYAVYMFETSSGSRWVVFRGTPVLGAPAECAYSENEGGTWANVYIGTVNNQGVNGVVVVGAMVVVCCTGGYIYESTNQGATWAAQEEGVETTEDLNDIAFHTDEKTGYAVGDNNAFLTTTNGGTDWAAGTGPAAGRNLLSVAINDKGHVFVTTNDGRVMRSEDSGATWATALDLTVGTIPQIRFDEVTKYIGGLIHNSAAPVGTFYRSEDGGATWYISGEMPTNAGLNAFFMCDHNHIAFVGNAQGGTTFIAMAEPTS